ncbi:MAG: hypothetical protein KIT31_20335 [Deltaproteobacteria bacterium]|nr:hypothetical protein [Deltaproteobacteria bacterium]
MLTRSAASGPHTISWRPEIMGPRFVLAMLIVGAAVGTARAEETGVYVQEALGGFAYGGDLGRPGTGAPRLQLGVGVRRGADTAELFVAGAVPDLLFIDCYGAECDRTPQNGFTQVGVDFRRQWPLVRTRWSRVGVSMFLHAGPRWVIGEAALAGMRGPGVGAGAGIAGDAKLIGYFLDFGLDAMWLRGPSGAIARGPAGGQLESRDLFGTARYIVIGGKLGWM